MTAPDRGVVLVTGASGFVGRALCSELRSRGRRVRAAARHAAAGPWDEVVALDLAQGTLPRSLTDGVDTVFHLAARVHARACSAEEEAEHYRVNLEGTRRLVDHVGGSEVRRFVFFSTVKAAADPGQARGDEDLDAPPDTAYGRSKRAAERLVLAAGAGEELHAAVLRLTPVYGAGSKGELRRMLEAVAARRVPPLPEVGNRRSLVHVGDVVAAALLAAQRPEAAGRTYIVEDGQAYSTRRIYDAMRRALGRPAPRWQVPVGVLRLAARGGDLVGALSGREPPFDSAALHRLLGSAWYSSARLQRELGWVPRCTLEEALPEMVASADPRQPTAAGVPAPAGRPR